MLLLGLVFLCAARAEPGQASSYKAKLQNFVQTYVGDAYDAKYTPSMNFDVPTVWLYSPKGDIIMQASSAEDGALSKLVNAFPPEPATAPLTGQPNLAFVDKVLAKVVSSAPAPLATQTAQWTAVLFLTDAPDCKQCAGFEKTMQELAGKNAGHLRLVRVTLLQ